MHWIQTVAKYQSDFTTSKHWTATHQPWKMQTPVMRLHESTNSDSALVVNIDCDMKDGLRGCFWQQFRWQKHQWQANMFMFACWWNWRLILFMVDLKWKLSLQCILTFIRFSVVFIFLTQLFSALIESIWFKHCRCIYEINNAYTLEFNIDFVTNQLNFMDWSFLTSLVSRSTAMRFQWHSHCFGSQSMNHCRMLATK